MTEPLTTIFVAGAVRDAGPGDPVNLRPGAVAISAGRIVAVGEPDAVVRDVKHLGPHRRIDLLDRLILPAMVNAHAHLDLTDIGPVPYDPAGGFVGWVQMVMKLRPQTEKAITRAVRNGLRMSKAAGVGWIGDIAGSDAAVQARLTSSDPAAGRGVSWIECFGFGKRGLENAEQAWSRAANFHKQARLAGKPDLLVDVQPHAPYSAGPEAYEVAHNYMLAYPSTHLAETREEDQFVRHASGPFADLLRGIDKWDASIQPRGMSPVQWLYKNDVLAWGFWLVAHCNYVDDADIAALAEPPGTSVAYCPIASEYFGHRDHRYRDMLAAGVNVCLGTDSILCQPPGEPQPLSILAPMRRLYRRDLTEPGVLLSMATWRGLEQMPIDNANATLAPNAPANLTAVRFDPSDPTDALTQVLLNDYPVEPLTA